MTEETQTSGGAGFELSAELASAPQDTYRALVEHAPFMRVEGIGVLIASRAGLDEILRDPQVFSSKADAVPIELRRALIPLQIDPPDHRKYRKILDPLFTPKKLEGMEEPIAALVNELIDAFENDDEIDFAKVFSVPLPSRVFLEIFGLPVEDLPRFLEMKDGIIRTGHILGLPIDHPEVKAHQLKTGDSIYEYFDEVLKARTGVESPDLISHFLTAEVEGDRLTHEEILDICFTFLIAGLDTVSASLECFFNYLSKHPVQRRMLVEDPECINRAVEELLRWETPVMGGARIATVDTEILGCPVAAGEQVLTLFGAANLDDAEFGDGGEVRFDRETNRHIAFGSGVHRCLGSHLARLELRIALREWHRRIPNYTIKPGVELNFSAGIRSLETFPMVLSDPSVA
jgi:cytochrome P450